MQTRALRSRALRSSIGVVWLAMSAAPVSACGGSDGGSGPPKPGSGGAGAGTGGTSGTTGGGGSGGSGATGGSLDAGDDVVLPTNTSCYLISLQLTGSIETTVGTTGGFCQGIYEDGYGVHMGFGAVTITNSPNSDDAIDVGIDIDATLADLPGQGLPARLDISLGDLWLKTPAGGCTVDVTKFVPPSDDASLGVDIEGTGTCSQPVSGNTGSVSVVGKFYFAYFASK